MTKNSPVRNAWMMEFCHLGPETPAPMLGWWVQAQLSLWISYGNRDANKVIRSRRTTLIKTLYGLDSDTWPKYIYDVPI